MAKKIGNLSSLQWALEQAAEKPRQPDEFTIAEFAAATGTTRGSAQSKLAGMAGMKKRLVVISGKVTNLYRRG